jgi:predicted AlkP superfamily phosphohydrolase/phosphomutase
VDETAEVEKVLALGFDAMDPDLLVRWCNSGDLPVLARLRAEGTWGRLNTPRGLADDAVWASFATGTHPGVHGKYSDFQFDPHSYVDAYTGAQQLLARPFWLDLSDAGCRVAVIDVPKCPLTPGINGIQLVDWRVHGRTGRTRSDPEELAAGVVGAYGDDENDIVGSEHYLCGYAGLSDRDRDVLRDRLLKSIDRKRQMLQAVLKRESWNLVVSVFKESHCAGHHFWEPEARSELQEGSKQVGTPKRQHLKSVYKALDRAIGQLLEEIDERTAVVVFSDLGMSDNVTGNDFLESVLLRLEPNTLLSLWGHVYSQRHMKGTLGRRLSGVNRRMRRYRTAFQVHHNEISGAVRMNVRNRERNGLLKPGADLDSAAATLSRELRNLRDPLSGRPIVDSVIRTEDLFPGAASANLPDLLVVWRRDFPISGAQSPRVGTIMKPRIGRRPGNHVPGGLFFAKGFTRGQGELQEPGSIMDLAPTIAALLGVRLGSVEGKVIPGLVRDSA